MNAPLTKEELLSYIPSRAFTDMLIDRFFGHVIQLIRMSSFTTKLII
jgi:hypothetical protein